MRYDKKVDGGYPLSMKEYDALRTLFGAVSALDSASLKPRLDALYPGSWEELISTKDKLMELMEKLLESIPLRKLEAIRRELKQTVWEVKIKPPSEVKREPCVYVPQKAVVRLIQRSIQLECLLCDKCAEDGLKCPLYNDINDCFPYELIEPGDKLCAFAGVSKLNIS